ncbi:hypothetical protein CC85DRAFT_83071 [Cutaneotrichosporon oleaginosum]|uniref:Uncharacterized protein n=1 Tax=Cutaneotrichosporon oleaginosum TaxID=879819 RepID=A0A0J0XN82_9TREE|nr:uncharacterized protein CC85DRAFT_83071 [Cutaneotrichosporon oleaginosum]KLT42533.1 hypothetical protein CC85DRAFT_83071 [Cutaneotrichosporon oleaginosum]TXT07803.1 hypothetical protein COLE_04727 [Cutaneotrichosporon oleaginosum]
MAQTLPNTAHTAHISTTPHSSHSDSHSIIHPHIHLEPPPPSQVNDLPAVERYPLLRALPPAMPSFDVSSPAPTPSRSTTLDQSDTDFEIDFSSSDDEAGVFFGTPKPVESKILAALSKSISSTPLTRERPPAPRRSSARLPKRDSREFLRRKTLLLSTPGAGPASEKMWEGGFVERPEDVDDEPLPGPSTPMVGHEDIAVDLDTVQLDTFPSSPEVTYLDAFFNEEEEDKENSAVPEEWDGDQEYDSEDAYVPAPPEGVPMSLGFCDGQYDLDMSPGLDMGGLSLLDIDDPEEMPFEFGNETGGAGLRVFLGASTSSSGSSIASASGAFSLHPHTLSPFRRRRRHSQSSGAGDLAHENLVSEGTSDREDEGADEVLDRPDVPILEETTVDSVPAVIGSDPAPSDRSEAANLDMESTGAQETPELEASILDGSFSSHEDLADGSCSHSSPNHPRAHSPFESLDMFSALAKAPSSAAKAPTFLDTTADLIAFTPLKPNGRTHLEVDSDSSYVSEVDSPRAPIMIPVFTVASPPRQRLARDPEPMLVDDIAPLDDDLGSAVALPTLDGPFGLVLSPFSRAPAANTTPGKSPSRLPVLSPVQSAKAQKTLARTAAAKEHLENLFSSKLGKSRLGESSSKVQPPVKRALVTSRLPSKATIQSPQVFTKSKEEPTARTRIPSPEAPSKGKGKAPEKPLKSILKSTSKVTQPKPFALSAPRQKVSVKLSAPGQSGLPRPTAAVASSLPRPVSKRPDPQVSTSTDASSTSKLFRITPKMPVARPVEAGSSVKRPPTANGMAMARVMAPVGPSMASASRSALGLPARLARDQSGDSAAFASSMSTGSSSGVLFHPPAKSPGRMMSPPKPVLGKPQRATGMTPISSRMMATPQRGVPTPSKVFKVKFGRVDSCLTISWAHHHALPLHR